MFGTRLPESSTVGTKSMVAPEKPGISPWSHLTLNGISIHAYGHYQSRYCGDLAASFLSSCMPSPANDGSAQIRP